jgi:hypothetical protein
VIYNIKTKGMAHLKWTRNHYPNSAKSDVFGILQISKFNLKQKNFYNWKYSVSDTWDMHNFLSICQKKKKIEKKYSKSKF